MPAEQKSLFELNLKMVDTPAEDIIDEERIKLNSMSWQSLPRQTFSYNQNDNLIFDYVALSIRCERQFKKNGKTEYLLIRGFRYKSIDELFEQEIPFDKIKELESAFRVEKDSFEAERLLPKDVLFDGHRYCWKFEKHEDGTIEFTDKWFPMINGDDKNAI
jgi:hypothetical protein